ncbi:MAG: hypothetical protein CME06_12440 [Gemmatimonadetes bacterium]|nr:hypothetical protein [Gemmatimonadota bacterium]
MDGDIGNRIRCGGRGYAMHGHKTRYEYHDGDNDRGKEDRLPHEERDLSSFDLVRHLLDLHRSLSGSRLHISAESPAALSDVGSL